MSDNGITEPVYCPRGPAGDFIVDAVDGIADFRFYKLPADPNGDGLVDENDIKMLSSALAEESSNLLYDLDGDGQVDGRDMLYLTARLLSEAHSFHFYTIDGQNLGLAPINWTDPHQVNVSGLNPVPEKIRIIIRDINGSSSVVSGIENLNQEWHRQNGFEQYLQSRSIQNSQTDDESLLSQDIIYSMFEQPLDFDDDEFLVSWFGSVSIVGITNQDTVENVGISQAVIKQLNKNHDKMNNIRFEYNMQDGSRYITTDKRWLGESGLISRHTNRSSFFSRVKYSRDGLISSVFAYSKTRTESHTINGITITIRHIMQCSSVYYADKNDKSLGSSVQRDDKFETCGEIKFERLGPGQPGQKTL